MSEEIDRSLQQIDVTLIHSSPFQTRKRLDGIQELASSIKIHGLLNPITVRPLEGEEYELIAGHRRLMAVQSLGMTNIPAIFVVCDDREAAEMCVMENMQRCDLTPLEEADGVSALIDTGHSLQDVADRLGQSRAWVARRAGLLKLCPKAKEAYENGENQFSLTPVAALEMIAALPLASQVEIVERFSKSDMAPTIANVTAAVMDTMMNLEDAHFGVEKCKTCPNRTGAQPDLFDAVATDKLGRCIDRTCFTKKRNDDITAKINELKFEADNVIICSSDSGVLSHFPELRHKDKLISCKEGTPNAVEAWEIKANGKLEVFWVSNPGPEKPVKESSEGEDDKPSKTTSSAKDKRMLKYCDEIAARIEATLDRSSGLAKAKEDNPLRNFPPAEILKLVCADNWKTPLNRPINEVVDILWARMAGVVLRSIQGNGNVPVQFENATAVEKLFLTQGK